MRDYWKRFNVEIFMFEKFVVFVVLKNGIADERFVYNVRKIDLRICMSLLLGFVSVFSRDVEEVNKVKYEDKGKRKVIKDISDYKFRRRFKRTGIRRRILFFMKIIFFL